MIYDLAGKDDLHVVGFVGLALYFSFFAVSLIRTLGVVPRVNMKHPKFAFHCAFTASFFFDLLYFLGFAVEGRFTIWAYVFHVVGLLFYLLAYSAVILLWAETLTFGGKSNPVPRLCITFAIVLHCVAAILVIGGLFASDGYDDFVDTYPIINIVFLVIHSTTFLFLTCGMLIYGIKLQRNLNANTMWLQSENSEKLIILAKINILLFVCTLCYALRVAALTVLFMDMVFGAEKTDALPELGWYIISQWFPTLVPACLLLHFMRVKDTARSSLLEENYKGGGTFSTRPRQTEDDGEERDSDFSFRVSSTSFNSETSDDKMQSPYKTKFPSDINRISFKSENSDFFIETESPLEHDQAMH